MLVSRGFMAFRPLTDYHLLPPSVPATLVIVAVAVGLYYAWSGRRVGVRQPTAVGVLLATNAAVFVLQGLSLVPALHGDVVRWNGLVPRAFVSGYQWWAIFTKMFVHGSVGHFAMNMLVLWFIGPGVEARLGRRPLLLLYLASGLFAGVVTLLGAFLLPAGLYAGIVSLPGPSLPNVGASGAIFGLLGFMVTAFPRERFMLIFPIPMAMRAWVLALIFIAINLFIAFTQTNIAWWAHLAGMAVGAVWALRWKRRGGRVRIDSVTGWGSGGPVRYTYSYRPR